MNWSFEEVLLLAVVDASFLGLSTNRQKGFSTRIQWVKIKFSSFKIMISLQSHNINFDPTFTGWHERIMVDQIIGQLYRQYDWPKMRSSNLYIVKFVESTIRFFKTWTVFPSKLFFYILTVDLFFTRQP